MQRFLLRTSNGLKELILPYMCIFLQTGAKIRLIWHWYTWHWSLDIVASFNYDCMNSALTNDLMVAELHTLFLNESWKLNKCNWNKAIIWYHCKFEWRLNGIWIIVEVCWIATEIWWNGNWLIWLNGKWNMTKIWLKSMVTCIWLKFD